MADEDTDGAFKDQSEQFLKSWMCANNAANYTERGRAFNPMSNTLGSTANAAMLALIYADAAEAEDSASADTYRCWALSQMRYVLGDSGQSLVVGVGKDAPEHTQDRAAGCPPAPAVCNHVTGYMSPKPDSHELNGALVQGPGKSDDYMDVRNNDASRVGIESNAGFIGALAGTVLLPERAWDVCLQSFGIYRSNPVCGDFVAM
jgi:endoglucanase